GIGTQHVLVADARDVGELGLVGRGGGDEREPLGTRAQGAQVFEHGGLHLPLRIVMREDGQPSHDWAPAPRTRAPRAQGRSGVCYRTAVRILLLGAAGQVGRELMELLPAYARVIGLARADVDLADVDALRQAVAAA